MPGPWTAPSRERSSASCPRCSPTLPSCTCTGPTPSATRVGGVPAALADGDSVRHRSGGQREWRSPNPGTWTADELLAVSASRLLADCKVVFAGVDTPLLASILARSTHAPHLTIVVE